MLPEGLYECRYCGRIRGTTPRGEVSLCLCDGINCRYCRAGRISRPISDEFYPDDGRWWHTPYFGDRAACRECTRFCRAVDGEGLSFPGPLRDHPPTAALVNAIHETARQLLEAGEPADESHGGLRAYFADPGLWVELGFGPPPDERPLYLGTGATNPRLAPAQLAALRVGSWRPGETVGVDLVRRELLLRWRPPLNSDEVRTPRSD